VGGGLAVSVAGNVGHVGTANWTDRATAAVPPIAAFIALTVALGVLKRVVALAHAEAPAARTEMHADARPDTPAARPDTRDSREPHPGATPPQAEPPPRAPRPTPPARQPANATGGESLAEAIRLAIAEVGEPPRDVIARLAEKGRRGVPASRVY